MSSDILGIVDLSVNYGKVEAVHKVTLGLKAGTIVTVIGPNGAGKSTLLNALMGVLPSQGHIQFEGIDIDKRDLEGRVMAGIALVPEKRELFSTMSVEHNLMLGSFRRYRRREPNYLDRMEYVYSIFPRLLERRGQLAGTLSGGERQMLAIGRALMATPKLLLLDEPSLGLAPRIVREILQIVGQLRDNGMSILLVEQNARAALQVADHAYVLEMGQVALQGPAATLAQDPRVIDAYLGLSHARAPSGEEVAA